jgi:hypothetical protein
MYLGTISFIFVKKEEQYNKLVQEYNELVDEYNQLEEVNFELRKEIKASLNRQLLDFLIGNCTKDEKFKTKN